MVVDRQMVTWELAGQEGPAWQQLRSFLCPLMWRATKASVQDDLDLPSRSVQVRYHVHRFRDFTAWKHGGML